MNADDGRGLEKVMVATANNIDVVLRKLDGCKSSCISFAKLWLLFWFSSFLFDICSTYFILADVEREISAGDNEKADADATASARVVRCLILSNLYRLL